MSIWSMPPMYELVGLDKEEPLNEKEAEILLLRDILDNMPINDRDVIKAELYKVESEYKDTRVAGS